MATTTLPALVGALARGDKGEAVSITETAVANTDYAVLMDDNNQIKLALITDLIGDGDITVGIDGTGYDVKFWGDTASSYMLWDQSEDTLVLNAAEMNFTGAADSCIDFSGITYVPTGSNGPSLTRCGTYGTPLAHAVEAQSGLMRWYMETSANGTSYDRGIFICLKTTGTKSIYPMAALAEVKAQTGAGPLSCMAGQFISMLQDSTSTMPASGVANGQFGIWAKVGATSGATTTVGLKTAPIWLDIQMNGNDAVINKATTWGIYMTTGSAARAFVGFVGGGLAGSFDYLFEWDSTCYDMAPISTETVAYTGNAQVSEGTIKILLNDTAMYIPYFAAAALT